MAKIIIDRSREANPQIDSEERAQEAYNAFSDQARLMSQDYLMKISQALGAGSTSALTALQNYGKLAANQYDPYIKGGLSAYDQILQILGLGAPAGGSYNSLQNANISTVGENNKNVIKNVADIINKAGAGLGYGTLSLTGNTEDDLKAIDNVLTNYDATARKGVIAGTNMPASWNWYGGKNMGDNSPGFNPLTNNEIQGVQNAISQARALLTQYNPVANPNQQVIVDATTGIQLPNYAGAGNTKLLNPNDPKLLSDFYKSAGFQSLFGGGWTPENTPMQNLANTPGYQFQLGSGVEALQKAAGARGLLGSTSLGTQLNKFGQDLGQTYYNDYMNKVGNSFGQYYGALQNTQDTTLQQLGNLINLGANSSNSLAGLLGNIGAGSSSILNDLGKSTANAMQNTSAVIANLLQNQGAFAGNSLLTVTAGLQGSGGSNVRQGGGGGGGGGYGYDQLPGPGSGTYGEGGGPQTGQQNYSEWWGSGGWQNGPIGSQSSNEAYAAAAAGTF